MTATNEIAEGLIYAFEYHHENHIRDNEIIQIDDDCIFCKSYTGRV